MLATGSLPDGSAKIAYTLVARLSATMTREVVLLMGCYRIPKLVYWWFELVVGCLLVP